MNLKEIIENLETSNNIIIEMEKMSEEYNYYTKYKKVSPILVIIGFFIIDYLIRVFINLDFIQNLLPDNLILVIIMLILPIFASIIITAFSYVKINYTMKSRQDRKYNDRKKEIENDYNNARDLLIKNSILPENYWYQYASSNILSYIINKRALSITDAINLYEEELKYQEQMTMMQNIKNQQNMMQDKMDRNYNEAKSAKFASWINLVK